MKPIPFAEINRELVPKDPLEQAQFGAALFEKCRLAHNAEPKTPEGKQRQKTLWLPKIRAACKLIAEARMLLPEPKDKFDVRFDKRAFLSSDIGAKHLRLIDIGKSFEKTSIHDMPDVDPLEDFTTYTEVDPNNRISLSSNTITATNLSRNEDAYVYRDCGIGHFTNFTHLFRGLLSSYTGSTTAAATIWAVSNTIDDGYTWATSNHEALNVSWYYRGGAAIILRDNTDGVNDEDRMSCSLNTNYYMTTERQAGSALTYIYSDSTRQTLLDTLIVSPPASLTYRYVFAVGSFNSGTTPTMSFTCGDLDLGEGQAFQPAWAEGINTHHF